MRLFAADQGKQLGRLLLHELPIAPALYVQPNQRLGVGRTQIEAPTVELHGKSVGEVFAARRGVVLLLYSLHRRFRVIDLAIDLSARREPLDTFADELRQALA